MGKGKGIAEGVVFDVSHIPPDYEPMAGYHQSSKRHHNALVHACEHNRIRRIRYRRSSGDSIGLLYVHRDDAAAILAESDVHFAERQSHKTCGGAATSRSSTVVDVLSSATNSQIELAVVALCEINNGITLMQATLERLAQAVESIATQPNAPEQEPLSAYQSNGFHQ